MRARLILSFLLLAVLGFHGAARAQAAIVVNGVALDRQTINALERMYGQLRPGRYWYDTVSGAWGYERGPTVGQIQPGMRLGGPLRRDASAGGTGVFINGRELHPADVAYLRQLAGTVLPGRYWVNAYGVGGYENSPPFFDLRALATQRGGRSWAHSGPGGHMASDGRCTGYFDPKSGASVMTGDC
jgi:hypothetical protein